MAIWRGGVGKFIALLATTTTLACVSPRDTETDASAGQSQTTEPDPREDGWRACLLHHPVCVQAVYCDAESATEWEVCHGVADRSCHHYDVPAGEECFDGEVGHCDGAGRCN